MAVAMSEANQIANTASLPHGVYIERRFRMVPRPLQTGEMVKIT